MQPSDIKVGTCYRTPRNEVRKVLEINADNRVSFVTRNGSQEPTDRNWLPGAGPSSLPKLSNFAFSVISEVPCDWNPETGNLVPSTYQPPAKTEPVGG